MPEPKKQSSPRKTGLRRSHLRLKLARSVNKKSPVKAFETAKKSPNLKVKACQCGVAGCTCRRQKGKS
jgi:ribosomal protein L32